MTLNFPNRLVWFAIGLVIVFLLQSGCQPIQAPPDTAQTDATEADTTPSPAASEEAARPDLSTIVENEVVSPNGEWIATTVYQLPRRADEYYQSLTVTHVSGTPSHTLVDKNSPAGLGYTLPVPLYWSEDGERFYYTNRPNPDGCALLVNASDLYRVDLASGESTELLPANTASVMALAPDEEQVAYRDYGTPDVILHDLATEEVVAVDVSSLLNLDANVTQDQLGAFIWSADSSTVAFAVAHQPCIGGWAESTSIYTLDATTHEVTAHVEADDRLLLPLAWPDADTLQLATATWPGSAEAQAFTLDLSTNEVTPAPAQ